MQNEKPAGGWPEPGAVTQGDAEPVYRTEQDDTTPGPHVPERADRSRIQETEDDGALGLTRTGQED
jgi:hypothetical protein